MRSLPPFAGVRETILNGIGDRTCNPSDISLLHGLHRAIAHVAPALHAENCKRRGIQLALDEEPQPEAKAKTKAKTKKRKPEASLEPTRAPRKQLSTAAARKAAPSVGDSRSLRNRLSSIELIDLTSSLPVSAVLHEAKLQHPRDGSCFRWSKRRAVEFFADFSFVLHDLDEGFPTELGLLHETPEDVKMLNRGLAAIRNLLKHLGGASRWMQSLRMTLNPLVSRLELQQTHEVLKRARDAGVIKFIHGYISANTYNEFDAWVLAQNTARLAAGLSYIKTGSDAEYYARHFCTLYDVLTKMVGDLAKDPAEDVASSSSSSSAAAHAEELELLDQPSADIYERILAGDADAIIEASVRLG